MRRGRSYASFREKNVVMLFKITRLFLIVARNLNAKFRILISNINHIGQFYQIKFAVMPFKITRLFLIVARNLHAKFRIASTILTYYN